MGNDDDRLSTRHEGWWTLERSDAPTEESAIALTDYQLTDRYHAVDGTVMLTGIQALARIPIEQLELDRAAGLDTAAMFSGYPGSPLGGMGDEVDRMIRTVPDLPIRHQIGVNEELAATTIMGTQLAAGRPDATVDGVVGLWYGKAPGLDRAGDALRHGVFCGASRRGGAVVLVGDDPACKSSTMPSSSDATLVDLHMPIMYPGTIAECLELGLHAVAISRATGLWASMKIVTPIADGSGSVRLPVLDAPPEMPTVEIDGPDGPRTWQCEPSARFLGPRMLEVEREFREIRIPLATEYGIANGINRISVDPADAWVGIVATGFTYFEVLDALRRLGLETDDQIAAAGIRLLHLRMPVPFNPALVRRFARGLDEIVVVEEKNATLEQMIKDALYGGPDQPRVVGKHDEHGGVLMKSFGRLDADAIIDGLRARLAPRIAGRLLPERAPVRDKVLIPLSVNRTPFFCSGCPHNWGTKVPEGSLVGAGTGCHGMSLLMDEDRVGETIGITAMGNEGAQWVGMAPFVATPHIFQNHGDGTFFHSAQLAVQYCVGAGVNITFKILYNGTVAMTGGQDASHVCGVPELAQILLSHGVSKVAVTADDTGRYRDVALPAGVKVHDRTDIVAVQEDLAATEGVTVLIHDQYCAAELRRDRRRGTIETPTRRIVINHRICEGCGDCGDVSNCLSVQPIDTPLGRKTTIDQASCNFDYSCVQGDCPAFMSVEVDPSVPLAASSRPVPPSVPDPSPTVSDHARIRMAGIGGTGVVTVAQVLATAAMLDGWDVRGLDQTGLSQKAGPVVSDIVLARPGHHASNLVGHGDADLILAFDGLVAAADSTIAAANPDETAVVSAVAAVPTGRQISHPDLPFPTDEIIDRYNTATRDRLLVDHVDLATRLTGNPATANILLLGVAVQAGYIPVDVASIGRAIELNGVAVPSNLTAFAWGRAWAQDPDAVRSRAGIETGSAPSFAPEPYGLRRDLPAFVHRLAGDLVDYQDEAYADRFLDVIERVSFAEREVRPHSTELTETAALSLHKLMAYKDEYEVARLMLLPEAQAAADAVGGPGADITWHLHPPLLAAVGREGKIDFGTRTRPVFTALAKMKRLRGTRLDPFGYTKLRRLERELADEFVAALDGAISRLHESNFDQVVELAGLPDIVRGFETLKLRRIDEYRARLAELTSPA